MGGRPTSPLPGEPRPAEGEADRKVLGREVEPLEQLAEGEGVVIVQDIQGVIHEAAGGFAGPDVIEHRYDRRVPEAQAVVKVDAGVRHLVKQLADGVFVARAFGNYGEFSMGIAVIVKIVRIAVRGTVAKASELWRSAACPR